MSNEVECRRFVCYLDILGFKAMVNDDKSRNWNLAKRLLSLKHLWLERHSGENVQWSFFSDAVVLFTIDDSRESFEHIVSSAVLGVWAALSMPDFALRGSLSIGDYHANPEEKIYFGKALSEAVEFEKEQDWMGVALTKSCSDYVRSNEWNNLNVTQYITDTMVSPPRPANITAPWVVEYDIPLKKGPVYDCPKCNETSEYNAPTKTSEDGKGLLAVNWSMLVSSNSGNMSWESGIENIFRTKGDDDDSVKRKLKNTIAFYHHCVKQNNYQ